MLEPIQIELEGETFQLTPMDPFKAQKADAKIMKVLAPLVGGLLAAAGGQKDVSAAEEGSEEPDFNVSGEVLSSALSQALGELDNTDALFSELFATVVWLPSDTLAAGANGKHLAQLSLDSKANISKAFAFIGAGPQFFYRLAFEVAKYNKFTPFVLLGGGEATPGMSGLKGLLGTKGLALGRLAGSMT
jgi:hypothetical protein